MIGTTKNGLSLEKHMLASVNQKTAISVIIPTFNGKEKLLLLLRSLQNQSVKDFEVIIVDDGSTDDTRDAISELLKNYSVPLRYYYLNNTKIFGAGIARNFGAKQAKGGILLFIDQDCVAAQDLIKKHLEQQETKDIILGYYAGYGDEKRCYDFAKLNDYVNQEKPIPAMKEFRDPVFTLPVNGDAWKYFVSAHFSVKKNIFNKINFDESFIEWGCEDIELGYRLFKSGEVIHLVKNCVVYNSSQDHWRTREKFLSLSNSLRYMYRKHHNEDVRRYCMERFYHTPLKYRDTSYLTFQNNDFCFQNSETEIVINEKCHAQVVVGKDFLGVVGAIEDIIPLIKGIDFDISVLKTLSKDLRLEFRNTFLWLIRVLRDQNIDINSEKHKTLTEWFGQE